MRWHSLSGFQKRPIKLKLSTWASVIDFTGKRYLCSMRARRCWSPPRHRPAGLPDQSRRRRPIRRNRLRQPLARHGPECRVGRVLGLRLRQRGTATAAARWSCNVTKTFRSVGFQDLTGSLRSAVEVVDRFTLTVADQLTVIKDQLVENLDVAAYLRVVRMRARRLYALD